MSGSVTSLRKEGATFVGSCSGGDLEAQFVLLATGLVDHCPSIDGEPANCPSDVVRFCPICDGYEAIDRRVGVLGDVKAGCKKALFLRTYTKDVLLFLTDETIVDAESRKKLAEENVRIVGKIKQIKLATESTVAVVTEGGKGMNWMLSTPLLVARFVLALQRHSELHALRMVISLLTTISVRPSKPFTRQGTS